MTSCRAPSWGRLLVLAGTLAVPRFTSAQEHKPKVACFNLRGLGEVTDDELGVLIDRILVKIEKTGRYETISMSMLNALLGQERVKDTLDCADGIACLAAIGGEAGSDFLITGSVTFSSGRYLILLSLIDVAGRKVARSDEFTAYGGRDALWEKADEIASRLFGARSVDSGERAAEIVVDLVPGNATYRLDGGPWQDYVPARLNAVSVAPGEHVIEVRAIGHIEWADTVVVGPEAVETVRVALAPVFQPAKGAGSGWISVESAPESGATVLLDGRRIEGQTPLTIKDVTAGKHHLVVKKALYLDYETSVTVQPKGLHRVQAALKENFGPVRISSHPEGATVYLDGVNQGTTPLVLGRVEAKAHKVRLTRTLYRDVQETFLLRPIAGFEKTFDLPPAFGTLVVEANEDGAQVLINGQRAGEAPVTLSPVPSGRVLVTVRKELYRGHEQQVDIVDGQTATIHASLVVDFGTLEVHSTPERAEVYVGEDMIGVTALEKRLRVGTYRVRISAGPTYHERVVPLQIERGKTHPIDVALQPRLGSLLVGANVHGGRVFVDGKNVGATPMKLDELFVGEHVVRVEHPEFETADELVSIVEGDTAEVMLVLRRLMPEELRARVLGEWEEARRTYYVWGFSLLGAAFVMGAVGGGVFAMAVDSKRAADALYSDYQQTLGSQVAQRWFEYEGRLADANEKAAAAEVLWAVGGAALVGGMIGLLMTPSEPETKVMPGDVQAGFALTEMGPAGSVRWSVRW